MLTRFFILTILVFFACSSARATHMVGGNFEISSLGGFNYLVKLKVYRDCSPGTATDVYPGNIIAREPWGHSIVSIIDMNNTLVSINQLDLGDPCIPEPGVCVEEYVFQKVVTIFSFYTSFYVTWTNCCRNNDIINIQNPLSTWYSFYARFPLNQGYNRSPRFGNYPTRGYLCAGEHNYIDDFEITDLEGDSLVFTLENISDESNFYPFQYSSWEFPANSNNVFGNTVLPNATIDRQTGVINCWPPVIGTYVISVKVREYRNGVWIGEAIRDVQYKAVSCAPKTSYLTVDFNSYSGDNDLLEGCSTGTVTITRPNTIGVQQVYLFYSGSASSTLDFPTGSLPNAITIPNGDSSVSFQISALEDFITESTETCKIIATTGGIACTYETSAEEDFFIKPGYTFNVTATNSGAICSGDSSTFDVNVITPTQTEYDILWDQMYTGAPNTYPGVHGQEHVVVVLDSMGCFGTDTITVIYTGHFFPDLGPDTVICEAASIVMGGAPTAPAGSIFNWYPNSFLSNDSIANPISSPDSSILYYLTATAPNGCASTDSVLIEVFQAAMTGMPNYALCPNTAIALYYQTTTSEDSIAWTWAGNTSSDPNINVSADFSTEYCLTAYNSSGCVNTVCDSLLIIEAPDFGLIHETSEAKCYSMESFYTIYGDTSRLNNWWFQGDNINPGYYATNLAFGDTSQVLLQVNDTNGCYYEIDQAVWIEPITSFYQEEIPNVFSPNGDGQNDQFLIEINGDFNNCSSFNIYNRWGQLVIASQGLPFSWDGHTQQGYPVTEGTYFYVITIANESKTGSITVFR
jgi:gliding motility-associated-like protein